MGAVMETAEGEIKCEKTLNGSSATMIFLTSVIAQVLLAALLQAIGGAKLEPLGECLFPIIGIAVTVAMVRFLIPKELKSMGPAGLAWSAGPLDGVLKGLVIGSFLGLGSLLLDRMYNPYPIHTLQKIEPLNNWLISPGVQQLAAVAAIVFLAPVSEEMMFRSVLYGGCRRSLGPLSAATITTAIFVAFHFPYYIEAPFEIVPFIVAALAFLWCRLKWNAIGPAIAAHAGCNLMAVVPSIHWTLQRYHSL
ncbi:MAG: lysostaphin resistance A-like protein [Limisphaerales bacterium]